MGHWPPFIFPLEYGILVNSPRPFNLPASLQIMHIFTEFVSHTHNMIGLLFLEVTFEVLITVVVGVELRASLRGCDATDEEHQP
jgi:hypothetical protein